MFSSASLLLLGLGVVTAALVVATSRVLLRGERARAQPAATAFGVQLVISLLLALAALWLFGEVIDRDKLARFDALVMVELAAWRTPTDLGMAKLMTRFGTSLVMSDIALMVMLTLHRRNWRAVAVGWTLVLGGGKLMEALLKHVLHRTRPIGALQRLSDPGYSYPGGHAMGSLIGYGLLAWMVLLCMRRPAARERFVARSADLASRHAA